MGGSEMVPEAQKPEWFEMAESDDASAAVTKVNKKLPAIAVLVTGVIIGAGAFFANASESNANAESITQMVASATSSPAATDPTANSSNTPSTGVQSPGATAIPSQGGIANPSQGGIQAPNGRDGDRDGDGEHRFGDGDGDRHERGGDGDHDRDRD